MAMEKILGGLVGPANVKAGDAVLSQYAVDGMKPRAVVFPGSTEEVAAVVRFAAKQNLAIISWGSGSKMGQGHSPSRLDLVLSTERLNRIIDMDTANLTATAQAGVKLRALQAALAGEENRCYLPLRDPVTPSDKEICSDRENRGCFVPLMPPCIQTTTLGGIIATGASGPTRLLYGLPRDLVLGVRFVASGGEIIGMGGKTVKNVSGYDMSKLMIGSFGTLGILCEMTLRLLPLPERMGTGVYGFSDVQGAFRLIDQVFGTSLLPASVELMSGEACRSLLPFETGENAWVVAIGMEGIEEAVQRMRSEIGEMASACGAEERAELRDKDHQVFWEGVSNITLSAQQEHPDIVSIRLNYPISCYREIVGHGIALSSQRGVRTRISCHAGSGVARMDFPGPGESQASTEGVVEMVHHLIGRCRERGGNGVVEKAGPGIKKRLPVWGLPGQDWSTMKRIKEKMDPQGLFSPGRFVDGV